MLQERVLGGKITKGLEKFQLSKAWILSQQKIERKVGEGTTECHGKGERKPVLRLLTQEKGFNTGKRFQKGRVEGSVRPLIKKDGRRGELV